MTIQLWGIKDTSVFDIWTLSHILAGIAIGTAILFLTKNKYKNTNNKEKIIHLMLMVLVVAYLWEILEYSFEIGLFGQTIANFFYSVEFLPNRLIVDPLTVLLGSFIAIKKPGWGVPAGVIAIAWFLIHIFIFPDVVYLQRLI